MDLQRWKGEAHSSNARAEAATAKAAETETMLQEWQQLKARVSGSTGAPQLSAEEAQLMAAMAVKEKEVALERANQEASKAATLVEESEALKQAVEVSEEAAHQERRRVEALDRKCTVMAEAHANALAEQADVIAALRKKSGDHGHGSDNGRAEALESEVRDLRHRLAGLQEAVAPSGGDTRSNGAAAGAQHDDSANGTGSGGSVGSQASSSSSALSVLAAGHLTDLGRCRRQLQEAIDREGTLSQEKEALESRCSQLKGQWQGAQREAAALGAERDLALRHSQQMEAMLETWRNVPTPSSTSGSGAMAQIDEATAAALTARVEGLAALNGSLSAELSECRAELNEARNASAKHQAAVVAAEASVASAKADGDSLRNRLVRKQEQDEGGG